LCKRRGKEVIGKEEKEEGKEAGQGVAFRGGFSAVAM